MEIKNLIRVFLDHIINQNTAHFDLFFEMDWTVRSTLVSYGHDIEGTWLLVEAAEEVDDEELLKEVVEKVKGGTQLSEALEAHKEFPGILVQMIKVGEETGELGNILETLAKFYRREVNNAVDTLVGLIEPIMIVLLGVGVGFLLASILIPIYNISASI